MKNLKKSALSMIALGAIVSAGTYGIHGASAQETDTGNKSSDKGFIERQGDGTRNTDESRGGKHEETRGQHGKDSGTDGNSVHEGHDRKSDRHTKDSGSDKGHEGAGDRNGE